MADHHEDGMTRGKKSRRYCFAVCVSGFQDIQPLGVRVVIPRITLRNAKLIAYGQGPGVVTAILADVGVSRPKVK
jgi:hypothetical protein